MDYSSALNWLYGTQQLGMKLGLENSYRLLDEFSLDPARHGYVFHIAGTNGKGSVCAFLESMLQADGCTTGMLTSPHLIHFGERIRINGQPTGEDELLEAILHFRERVSAWDPHPTFFELTTALCLHLMARHQVRSVILETGLGGRLDSTNATRSDCAIISSIGWDHQASLGNTLGAIAREKAGILQPGKSAYVPDCLEPEALTSIENIAKERSCPLHLISPDTAPSANELGLKGAHQRTNAALATAALRDSPLAPPLAQWRQGLADTRWPGRFQSVAWRGKHLILDGAHNTSAAEALVATWRTHFPSQQAALIFGTVKEKDPAGLLAILSPICKSVTFTTTPSERGLPADLLSPHLPDNTALPHQTINDPAEALSHTALRLGDTPILITGSLYLVGKMLEVLGESSQPFQPSLQ
ncbi:MAG: folylpolyglutamate synthase/dihydrofolate synthase family protein [Verrucomicrobiota bacterium]